MIYNDTHCDLCAASVPTEIAQDREFSTVVFLGHLRQTARAALAAPAPQIDLCPACGEALLRWAIDHKAAIAARARTQAAPTEPPAPTPAPAPEPPAAETELHGNLPAIEAHAPPSGGETEASASLELHGHAEHTW